MAAGVRISRGPSYGVPPTKRYHCDNAPATQALGMRLTSIFMQRNLNSIKVYYF